MLNIRGILERTKDIKLLMKYFEEDKRMKKLKNVQKEQYIALDLEKFMINHSFSSVSDLSLNEIKPIKHNTVKEVKLEEISALPKDNTL